MFSITDIVQSYLNPKKFKQPLIDHIRHVVNADPKQWECRVQNSAKRILPAVCFRETARVSCETASSLIYQPIGLYYSMFHMSLAMLWLNPRVETSQLSHIRHKKLINLVEAQLVQPKLLESSFLDLLKTLKKLRESCNYNFGYQDNLGLEMTQAMDKTEKEFDYALEFIHQVLNISESLLRVQIGIGDGFGDDILDSYLSPEHKENVSDYLVTHGLST